MNSMKAPTRFKTSCGVLALGVLWLVDPTASFACERPQERSWLHSFATLTDVCDLGMTTTDVTSDVSSSRGRGGVAQRERAIHFATNSLEPLSQDIARGGGEYLASLATLLGVPSQQHHLFFSLAQNRFEQLALTEAPKMPEQLVASLQTDLAMHPVLAHAPAFR